MSACRVALAGRPRKSGLLMRARPEQKVQPGKSLSASSQALYCGSSAGAVNTPQENRTGEACPQEMLQRKLDDPVLPRGAPHCPGTQGPPPKVVPPLPPGESPPAVQPSPLTALYKCLPEGCPRLILNPWYRRLCSRQDLALPVPVLAPP